MTQPIDKLTLQHIAELKAALVERDSVMDETDDEMSWSDAVSAFVLAMQVIDHLTDTLTAQLADRDALIVRQAEMLERAQVIITEANEDIDGLYADYERIANPTIPGALKIVRGRDMRSEWLAALQDTAAKNAGDGEVG